MKKTLLILLLVSILIVPAFAGGNYQRKDINKVIAEIMPTEPTGPDFVDLNKAIKEHEDKLHIPSKAVKIEAQNGFALGFYGGMFSLKLPEIMAIHTEAGALGGTITSGFVKAWFNLLRFESANFGVGLASFMAENASSATGLYLSVEKYLDPNVSIYADAYPVILNSPNNSYGNTVFGGRLYF